MKACKIKGNMELIGEDPLVYGVVEGVISKMAIHQPKGAALLHVE